MKTYWEDRVLKVLGIVSSASLIILFLDYRGEAKIFHWVSNTFGEAGSILLWTIFIIGCGFMILLSFGGKDGDGGGFFDSGGDGGDGGD